MSEKPEKPPTLSRMASLRLEPSTCLSYNISPIQSSLYLGGKNITVNKEIMQEMKITHIINCSKDIPNNFEDTFSYLRVPVGDSEEESIEKYFDMSNNFIKAAFDNNGTVFVHCSMGISRSTTIIIAYLLHIGMSLKQSFHFVSEKRPVIRPNCGFMRKLIDLEKKLYGKVSLTIEQYNASASIIGSEWKESRKVLK
eukprot:g1450.t1